MIAYLSGPIENANNDGVEWRNMMTEWLESELNHRVFNPVIETKSIVDKISIEDFTATMQKVRKKGSWKFFIAAVFIMKYKTTISKIFSI